jgi:hypothetical protein
MLPQSCKCEAEIFILDHLDLTVNMMLGDVMGRHLPFSLPLSRIHFVLCCGLEVEQSVLGCTSESRGASAGTSIRAVNLQILPFCSQFYGNRILAIFSAYRGDDSPLAYASSAQK